MKNWIKITIGIIGTIFLGAIGSGLWERFLSPLADSLVILSVEFVNTIFKSYKDGIYETASLGFHESYSLMLFVIYVMVLPFLYLRLLKTHPATKNESSEYDKKLGGFLRSEKGYIFLLILTVTVTISSLFIFTKIIYTNQVITYSMRSLDIVKPYIPSEEHNKLVSTFYQVRNTDDFHKFNKIIQEIAEKNSLRLPANTLLQ